MNKEFIDDINAVLAKHGWKYRLGDQLQKKPKVAHFVGKVTGIYITDGTVEGYALTSEHDDYKGTTQIYPVQALEGLKK